MSSLYRSVQINPQVLRYTLRYLAGIHAFHTSHAPCQKTPLAAFRLHSLPCLA